MWRALLISAVPAAALVASLPDPAWPGLRDEPLRLKAVPIAQGLQRVRDRELARCRAEAEGGNLEQQVRLGCMYLWGAGAPVDWVEARIWLRKASERDHPAAQAKLGAMCFLGQGGPRDLAEALKWFRRSADQGEANSQCCLGMMYLTGMGVPRNLLQAYIWLYQAKAGGNAGAARPLEMVKRLLSPAQVREGDRLAAAAMEGRKYR